MTISFEKTAKELILCYSPAMGTNELLERLSLGEELMIKRTFFVVKEHLRDASEDDYEEKMRFCIGEIGSSYTLINPAVLNTNHRFFFANDITLDPHFFTAYRNISILRKIDDIIDRDFYVGGNWEKNDGIPFEAYKALIESFPKTAELNKYADSRIAVRIKEFFPECEKYEIQYERFISNRDNSFTVSNNDKIEYEQFISARNELKWLLNNSNGYSEANWQMKINGLLQLLYPKYILCTREIVFTGVDGYDKRPDFVLVDANGFVDILEIKKPDVQLLTKQASYRNNYVPVRELSGAIQQIEKYIFCLTSVEKSQREVVKKLTTLLPDTVFPEIVNPQGILIAGRSNNYNSQQKRDFELIKRQYKHVADIMTYDDLLMRFENIVISLGKRIGSQEG